MKMFFETECAARPGDHFNITDKGIRLKVIAEVGPSVTGQPWTGDRRFEVEVENMLRDKAK